MKNVLINKGLNIFKGIDGYILLCVVVVVVIYTVNLIGVELLSLKPRLTYFIATSINYVISYFGQANVFKQRASKRNLSRFLIFASAFFIVNNYGFHVWLKYLNLHYVLAITINVILFPLAKFFTYKYIVFKKNYG